MDAAQIVLLLVIVVLTILLIVLGIQVYFILRELRKTVMKANKVLDDTGSITGSVSRPISSLSSFATDAKIGTIITVAKVIKSFLGKERPRDKKTKGE